MLIFLMLCQRKLNKPDVTVLEPSVLTEESCSVITFSLSALSQKVSKKGQFPGVKDRYNNI